MVHRNLEPSPTRSYFLFGARGTGKTTLLHQLYDGSRTLFIDLLDPAEEDLFSRSPGELALRVAALPGKGARVIIDEVQKVPRLLDVVHGLIETTPHQYIMTGSSARKLKRGASNLLAGRAFVYHLHPFTVDELGETFLLDDALCWGTLPGIFRHQTAEDKAAYLRAYALTYLKEEIQAEQLVRRLDPFRHFLEIAAQTNGMIVNYSRIADDVGVDTKTVQEYFSILEDTLVGFMVPAYHRSVRKRQRANPKFYLFDNGVRRALDRSLTVGLVEGTYAYGNAFEHFMIAEILHRAAYRFPDWRFSYLRTKDDAEIDLVIDRPGLPVALVEFKSANVLAARDTVSLERFVPDFPGAACYCLSRDPHAKTIGAVRCLPWREGLAAIFGE